MRRTTVWLAFCCVGCSGGRLSASQAAAACVMQSCFPHEFADGYFGASLAACASGVTVLPPFPGALIGSSGVTTGLEGPLGDVYLCLAKSSGCSAAASCLGRAGTSGSCSPPSDLWDAGCDGTVLEGCLADGVAFDVDCSKYGEGCRVDFPENDQPLAMCDEGACPADGDTQCEGSQAQVCLGPGVILDDCAREGLSCAGPPSSPAGCYIDELCAGTSASCNGSVVDSCQGGVPKQLDCSQNGTFKRCSDGACVETGTQCTVAGDQPSCDGTSVKLCQDGNEVAVDCTGLGFTGCQAATCQG